MNPKKIAIKDFDYPLKEENIAKFPLKQRDEAKLLCFDGDRLRDEIFSSLPFLLDKDTLLVFNDTKVIYARLFFYKTTGSKIEIFCLEPFSPSDVQLAFDQREKVVFKCLIGNNKKWKDGPLFSKKTVGGEELELSARRLEAEGECWRVEFSWNGGRSFAEMLEIFGVVPLPPYLNRDSVEEDKADYQTLYAHFEGSVAAPTAGLHFSEKTFADLKKQGIETDFVTLHVGAGTFKPVTSDLIEQHLMHTERILVNKSLVKHLSDFSDRKIICVGTTSVRTVESLYWYGVSLIENNGKKTPFYVSQWQPYQERKSIDVKEALQAVLTLMEKENIDCLQGETQLLIAPPYSYKVISGMVTNFHQPKSTLLLLVSALIGDKWQQVYKHALENNYRFLSYGDACLFMKNKEKNEKNIIV
ncbi:MAG: S-adenosylmethionine:tRNA ribosyltransferase-isomerase [Bacteroidales bacterium]|nr:S-adenosylmethionine:tRNA ribosyltransferase-isomerase [Bacteroidales bacterium]